MLVRVETSPEDIHGMHAAKGILTTRGGMTSHAAVVARGMGRACVAGAGEIRIDYAKRTMSVRDKTIREGEVVTIDGSSGEVFVGAVPTVQPELSGDFAELMGWADGLRRLKVRANAETPLDARTARKFGAEGIGLCRTEHMFFDPERIVAVREMIMAEDAEAAPRRWPRSSRCSSRTSPSCSRSWPGCRSRSGCSIRRCTSSCRTATTSSPSSQRRPARTWARCARAPCACTKPTRCSGIAAAASR